MRTDILNWWNELSLNKQIELCCNAFYDIDNIMYNQIIHLYHHLELYL